MAYDEALTASDEALRAWVERGAAFASSLPTKSERAPLHSFTRR
jgi:hypothetical protein